MIHKIKKIDKHGKALMVNVWQFLKDYSVMNVAIGVIVANVAKDLVDALVKGLFLPLINLFFPEHSLTNLIIKINGVAFNLGNIINNFLTFIIVILILYFVVKKLVKDDRFIKLVAGEKKQEQKS